MVLVFLPKLCGTLALGRPVKMLVGGRICGRGVAAGRGTLAPVGLFELYLSCPLRLGMLVTSLRYSNSALASRGARTPRYVRFLNVDS